uniref:Uncharacterized protein n=1 Tax=Anguilla anguilla TaxID=7936 RepID=A0A0E9TZR0_ANGAN
MQDVVFRKAMRSALQCSASFQVPFSSVVFSSTLSVSI